MSFLSFFFFSKLPVFIPRIYISTLVVEESADNADRFWEKGCGGGVSERSLDGRCGRASRNGIRVVGVLGLC